MCFVLVGIEPCLGGLRGVPHAQLDAEARAHPEPSSALFTGLGHALGAVWPTAGHEELGLDDGGMANISNGSLLFRREAAWPG